MVNELSGFPGCDTSLQELIVIYQSVIVLLPQRFVVHTNCSVLVMR